MVARKLPEREFKGLLNFVRERITHVYGINFLRTALKKAALVQASKRKPISLYQLLTFHLQTLENCDFFSFTLKQVKQFTYIVPFAIAELGHICLKPAATVIVRIMKIFKCYASEHL